MSHMNGNGTEPKIGAAKGVGRAEPNPEVTPKPRRRQYTAEYKLRILAEVEACTKPGEIGALLRREGLYSSALDKWRKQRKRGVLQALEPAKRGPKADPYAAENARLRREVERLQARLRRAETIIEVQKKVSTLLGMTLEDPADDTPL